MENTNQDNIKMVTAPHLEPDVVVVVGGSAFRHRSIQLRSWSEYFDAAYRSGMQQTGRFEFPDKDPEEWKLLLKITDPFSAEAITKDNVLVVLPWFDFLCCSSGLAQCDKVLSTEVLPDLLKEDGFTPDTLAKLVVKHGEGLSACAEMTDWVKESQLLFNILDGASQYNLELSKKGSLNILGRVAKKGFMDIKMDSLHTVSAILKENKDASFCDDLWDIFKPFLPETLPETRDELLDNRLFLDLLMQGMMQAGSLRAHAAMLRLVLDGRAEPHGTI